MQASLWRDMVIFQTIKYAPFARVKVCKAPRRVLWINQGYETRRYVSTVNPLTWVKEKLAASTNTKQDSEQIRVGKQIAAKQGTASVFETVPTMPSKSLTGSREPDEMSCYITKIKRPNPTNHKYSTRHIPISHRKLNLLARQISGKPIDYAILQMQFSEKRVSSHIMNTLATARDHAKRYKKLDQSKLVVSQAWVTKGLKRSVKMDIRGRGRTGLRVRLNSRMYVELKEGKTLKEKKAEDRARKLKRIISAAIVREDVPIRNPSPTWGW